MRTFNITVNGQTYQVQAEETTGGVTSAAPITVPISAPVSVSAPIPAPSAPAPAAAAPAPKPAAPAAPVTGGEPIKSPMPGTIISVKVSAGQHVKKHEVLVILEAMKMENEIVTPRDGVVAQVVVSKGASVNTDDALIILQ